MSADDVFDQIAGRARYYAEEIADCSCASDPDAGCWYHMTRREQVEYAFNYSLTGFDFEDES